jgi:hypothetical protein
MVKSKSTGALPMGKSGLSEKAAAIVKGARKRKSEGCNISGSLVHIKSPGKGLPKKKRTVLEALESLSRSTLSGDDLVQAISQTSSPVRKLNNMLGHNKQPKKIKDLLHARSKSEPTTDSTVVADVSCLPKGRGKKRPTSLIETFSDLPIVGKKLIIATTEDDDVVSNDTVKPMMQNTTSVDLVKVTVTQHEDIEDNVVSDKL